MKEDERWQYFKCRRCGLCCKEIGLPYDSDTVIKLSDRMKVSISEIINRYYGKVIKEGVSFDLQDEKGIPCPFLKKNGEKHLCEIYDIRPSGCKMYPLQTDAGCQDVECPAYIIANIKYEKEFAFKDRINE